MYISAYSYAAQLYIAIGANDRESDTCDNYATCRDLSGVVGCIRAALPVSRSLQHYGAKNEHYEAEA